MYRPQSSARKAMIIKNAAKKARYAAMEMKRRTLIDLREEMRAVARGEQKAT